MKIKKTLKKVLKVTLFSSLISLYSNIALADPLVLEGIINSEVANLRDSNNNSAEIITSLKKGSKVSVTAISLDNEWYYVTYQSRVGWLAKNNLIINKKDTLEYKNVSTIGSLREQGVLNTALKIDGIDGYKYVVDHSDKINLNIYDENDNFVKSIKLNYSWITSSKDYNYIVLAVDKEKNFYTNLEQKNQINKYNFEGVLVPSFKLELSGLILKAYYNIEDNSLYLLDGLTKTIKVFDDKGTNNKNIFLSETKIPKDFSINKGKIYVLDYPENEFESYQLYYVDSYSYSLYSNTDFKSPITEEIPKGSILKFNNKAKIIKNKVLLENDAGKAKEYEWIDFSDIQKKQYGTLEKLKKVNIIGEIDIYKTSGEPLKSINLNDKWLLKTIDRHRNIPEGEITRKLLGILVNSKEELVIPILSKTKSGILSLNYYYMNNIDKTYKISQAIPVNENLAFYQEKDLLYFTNAKGYLDIFNENGLYKTYLGRISPYKFNNPSYLNISNNNLFVFDRGTNAIGQYDLNGEAQKVKYIDQNSDKFEYNEMFFGNKYFFLLKTLIVEENKLGLEIYNYSLNKIFDSWFASLTNLENLSIFSNEKNQIFITGSIELNAKKYFMLMLNDKGHIINKWKTEADLNTLYSEDELKEMREKSIKFMGSDNQGNAYILLADRNGKYKINIVRITEAGRAEILRNLDVEFFSDTTIYEENNTKIEKKVFSGAISGQILGINLGKNNFTYILFKNFFTKVTSIGIYEPTGKFFKEISLKSYENVRGFSLDNNDNIWITSESSIRKLANYN